MQQCRTDRHSVANSVISEMTSVQNYSILFEESLEQNPKTVKMKEELVNLWLCETLSTGMLRNRAINFDNSLNEDFSFSWRNGLTCHVQGGTRCVGTIFLHRVDTSPIAFSFG